MIPPDPGVVITSGQVYAEVRQMHDAMTRMEVKLDTVANQRTAIDDHEKRLRALERARWPLPTIGALIGIAGVILALVHR
jgi:hypothetical protein